MDLMAEFQKMTCTIDAFADLVLDNVEPTKIVIQWSIVSVTSDTELAALRHLTEEKRIGERKPAEKSIQAFKTILDFHRSDKNHSNLHNAFPQLADPFDRKHKIKRGLLQKFASFNEDHRAAYRGLTNYADGLYFLQGCPGAGKTEFNMVLTALIQSCVREKPKRRHSPVLFLVDINKTVDDAANRYFQLCQEVGLGRLRIIRMHGFPYEFRNSVKIQKASHKEERTQATTLDFTKRFLTTTNLLSMSGLRPSSETAPTLDEAAWKYYESHKTADCFHNITKFLRKLATPDTLSASDWKDLRNAVTKLYVAVLAQADFIATTPVAASGWFSKLFRPEVIIIDEAPHARELTTLIPIAYFDPLLWMFTGDVSQTQPFVKGVKGGKMKDPSPNEPQANPYEDQLRLSTMARAAAVGALNAQLLVNRRAHGNLHRLPSALFYGGQMRTAHDSHASMYPGSTAYLRSYLARIGGISSTLLKENRVIIQLDDSCERKHRSSFWNPAHHNWVIQQAKAILSDPKFLSLHGGPGTLMIQSPYKSATREYEAEVRRWDQQLRDRVEVLTVDKAQGNQADVVLLDMVRSTTVGFMDDPQRLNVAITRARQAEIIVMNPAMTRRRHNGTLVYTKYMFKLWDDTVMDGRLLWPRAPKEEAGPLREIDLNTETRDSMQKSGLVKEGVSVSC